MRPKLSWRIPLATARKATAPAPASPPTTTAPKRKALGEGTDVSQAVPARLQAWRRMADEAERTELTQAVKVEKPAKAKRRKEVKLEPDDDAKPHKEKKRKGHKKTRGHQQSE